MNKKLNILIGAAALTFAACSNEDTANTEKYLPQGEKLSITADSRAGATADTNDNNYEAFKEGSQIRLYYGYQNLNSIPWYYQGIYSFSGTDKTKKWKFYEQQGTDQDLYKESIFIQHIINPNNGGQYWFTATSYPEPLVENSKTVYTVKENQSDKDDFDWSDFVVARAVTNNKVWTDENSGLELHFRHVLCRLRVILTIPYGNTNDGYFPDKSDITSSVVINNRKLTYGIVYDETKGDTEILEARANGDSHDLTMYRASTSKQNSIYEHVFEAILPKQSMDDLQPQGKYLLNINIDGKNFGYNPPTNNYIPFEQEKITVLKFTVYYSGAAQKVKLTKITIDAWDNDTADVGTMDKID